jgi:hypothetical protein
MYRTFFGLRATPFGPSPDPRFLCMTPQIREALARLKYSIATRNGSVCIDLDLDRQPLSIYLGAPLKATNKPVPVALSSAARLHAESTDSAKDIEL